MRTVAERAEAIRDRCAAICKKWLTEDLTQEEYDYVMYPPNPLVEVTPETIEAIRRIGNGPVLDRSSFGQTEFEGVGGSRVTVKPNEEGGITVVQEFV